MRMGRSDIAAMGKILPLPLREGAGGRGKTARTLRCSHPAKGRTFLTPETCAPPWGTQAAPPHNPIRSVPVVRRHHPGRGPEPAPVLFPQFGWVGDAG